MACSFSSGFSLLELMVAMLVTLIFIGAVYTTFIQISKGHQYAEARMDAVRNGRTALATMSKEIKEARQNGSEFEFTGTPLKLVFGDGIDNDGDGEVDEEMVDGRLTTGTAAASLPIAQIDQHATLGTHFERPLGENKADLGDRQVDVDAVFGRDILTFITFPTPPTNGVSFKKITYAVKRWEPANDPEDAQENVLVRRVEINYEAGGEPDVSEAPLAFKVAGMDLLYWNPNNAPEDQGWVDLWNSENTPPPLRRPASVYIRLTMIADPRPLEAVAQVWGEPVDVIPMETIVNIEEVIDSGEFISRRPLL